MGKIFKQALHKKRHRNGQFSSVTQSCLTLCDPMNHSTPGLPVHDQLPDSSQTHVHWVGDAIQPSHLLSSPFPTALNISQHQGLFKWVSTSHQVAKVLEFHLQHQSSQWTPRTFLALPQSSQIQWNQNPYSSSATAAKSLQSCPTLCDPIASRPPGSPSLGFSRQEHWSGLPFPSLKLLLVLQATIIMARVHFLGYFLISKVTLLVQSLNHVWVLATLETAAHQAFLSITNSRSLHKVMSIELVMLSSHLILCHPLLMPSIFPNIRDFSNELAFRINQVVKVLELQL